MLQKQVQTDNFMVIDYQKKIIDKILTIKKERNAIILAHNYVLGEVQDIADFTGDSLGLSRKARTGHNSILRRKIYG